jgi:hypothetical protein
MARLDIIDRGFINLVVIWTFLLQKLVILPEKQRDIDIE